MNNQVMLLVLGGDDFVPEERDSPVPVERNFIVSVGLVKNNFKLI